MRVNELIKSCTGAGAEMTSCKASGGDVMVKGGVQVSRGDSRLVPQLICPN